LSQITDGSAFAQTGTQILNNIIIGNSYSYQLEIAEETASNFSGATIAENSFSTASTASKFVLPRGRAHFAVCHGNTVLNNASSTVMYQTFTSGDTTPSVAIGDDFICSNSGATSITYFDDAMPGQEITIRMDANTTLVHDTNFIRLKGSTNVTTPGANAIITLRYFQSIWFEVSRGF